MKWTKEIALICVILLCSLGASTPAFAQTTYEVTIHNLTQNQVITPPVVVSHSGAMSLFTVGQPVIPELATLAEEGDPGPLMGLLPTLPAVMDFDVGPGPIPPAGSMTLQVMSAPGFRRISAVGMLATTNDAFFAISGVQVPLPPTLFFFLPFERARTLNAPAYDAGSEADSELCAFIPGPPCGNNLHDPAPPEGFVHISNGVHGVGDLPADGYDLAQSCRPRQDCPYGLSRRELAVATVLYRGDCFITDAPLGAGCGFCGLIPGASDL